MAGGNVLQQLGQQNQASGQGAQMNAPMGGKGGAGMQPGLGGPTQASQITQGPHYLSTGGFGGVAPFAQGAPTGAAYAPPSYQPLSGGGWNQLTQQLAGPQYTPKTNILSGGPNANVIGYGAGASQGTANTQPLSPRMVSGSPYSYIMSGLGGGK